MKEITKEEFIWLVDQGHIKLKNGAYIGLKTCSKRKRASGKSRYVTDPIYEKLSINK